MTTTLTQHEATFEHEAHHVAMSIACGQYPVSAQVGGLVGLRGEARYVPRALQHPADERWREALVALAPHIEGAEWPLGDTPDEAKVTGLVEQVATKQDREAIEVFTELLGDAELQARQPAYKRLVVAFSRVLELNGRLDQQGIAKACEIVSKTFNDEPDTKEGPDVTPRPRLEYRTFPTRFKGRWSHLNGLFGTPERQLRARAAAERWEADWEAKKAARRMPIQIKTFEC